METRLDINPLTTLTSPSDTTRLFNVMEWGILMAITEDMTLNTLQQRMLPQKTYTKTPVEILYN